MLEVLLTSIGLVMIVEGVLYFFLANNLNKLFKINCHVSDEAELGDEATISTNVRLILDTWGNNGIPYVNIDGTVTISEVLSSGNDPNQLPLKFSLDRVHPNPFNPTTSISFSVPEENHDPVFIRVFNLNGGLVAVSYTHLTLPTNREV